MPLRNPPLCREFMKAIACERAAEAVVRSLQVIADNSDTDQVGRLAKETLKLAHTLRKRARIRWRTVSAKHAEQPSLLDDAASTDDKPEDPPTTKGITK